MQDKEYLLISLISGKAHFDLKFVASSFILDSGVRAHDPLSRFKAGIAVEKPGF